jgi:hypothetical protein
VKSQPLDRISLNVATRVVASALVVWGVYAAHWVLTYLLAVALTEDDSGTFECWGHTHTGYCTAAWGGWSAAMYLPEVALAAAAVAGLATRRFGVWKWGLGAAVFSVLVFVAVAESTHLWAINQMPVIWPDFP